MNDVNLKYFVTLKPEQIIEWFEKKGYEISWNWDEVFREAHNNAFTVAKAMKLDILQTIRSEVNKIFTDGITPRDFQKKLEPMLKDLGWWGKVAAKDAPGYDPASGEDPDKIVELGSPRRLAKIFRINAKVAYSVGRWKSQWESRKSHPFLKYIQIQRASKRDEHKKWHNKVFRINDPIWNAIYPPSDWECGCRTVAVSQDTIDRQGLKVSKGKDFDTSDIPEEWRYNPGKTAFAPDLSEYDADLVAQYNKDN